MGVGGEGEGGGGRRRCRRKEECKVALSQQSTSKQSGTLKTSMEACFSFLFHNSAAMQKGFVGDAHHSCLW